MTKFLSILNKLKDFGEIEHKTIRKETIKILKNQNLDFFDYGFGYFYQSINQIKVSGLRNTKKRCDCYELDKYVTNAKQILDIGSNTGSIIFEIFKEDKKFTGIEYNKTLIQISKKVQEYLNFKNIEFLCEDFLKFETEKKFDLILSLANHTTFDKGIESSEVYFNKVFNLLENDGIILIESHHPKYEKKEDFEKMIVNLVEKFKLNIINEKKLITGSYYDDGRNFYFLKK